MRQTAYCNYRELGTICWPNGAALDPDVLYAKGEFNG